MKDEWKERLEEFFEDRNRGLQYTRDHAREFFEATVSNAFAILKGELEKYGHQVATSGAPTSETLHVFTGNEDEFHYRINADVHPDHVTVVAEASTGGSNLLTDEREQYIGLASISQEEIIEDFLDKYFPYMRDLTAKDWRAKQHRSQTA